MKSFLRRYTELPFAIDYLQSKELKLLNPASWDDRNDSYYIEKFVEATSVGAAFALCLADSPEAYHHWRVFSHGSGGVCIEFDKDLLLLHVHKMAGLRAEPVKYRTINELRSSPPNTSELPFLKRAAFRHEGEFRLFVTSYGKSPEVFPVKVPLKAVDRVILSPWLPRKVADTVKTTLRKLPGCAKLKIYRSTLVENENWKRFAAGASNAAELRR